MPATSFAQLEDGNYQRGDTLVEIISHDDFNYISEFRKIKGQDLEPYRSYYFDTKKLKEEGTFKSGWWFGTRKLYGPDGKLQKTIDYKTNNYTFHNGYLEHYEAFFNFIKDNSDNLLKAQIGESLFNSSVIQNTNRSIYYGSETSGNWFDATDFKPEKFLMVYDLRWSDEDRFELFKFDVDSLGNSNDIGSIKKINNFKGGALISKQEAEIIALKNGINEKDKPYQYKFILSEPENNLTIRIWGKPYEVTQEGNTVTRKYVYVLIDAFTGVVISVENKSQIPIYD